MTTGMNDPRFVVIVPVKPLARAKTRLAELGPVVRRQLAVAFALDTVTAALASPLVLEVLVVTDDHDLGGHLRDLGARVTRLGADAPLNAALTTAAASVAAGPETGASGASLVALLADLPSLRAPELTRVLQASAIHPSAFVADAEGTGTTLLVASHIEHFTPRFGPGSCAAHRAAGAAELNPPGIEGLRRDVDTAEHLRKVLELGVGAHTSAALAAVSL